MIWHLGAIVPINDTTPIDPAAPLIPIEVPLEPEPEDPLEVVLRLYEL